MRRIALEVFFAILVTFSFFTGRVLPATTNTFDMSQCATIKAITDQIDLPLRYDLKGEELAIFNKHFTEQTGMDTPDGVDEIVVFARDGDNVFALFVTLYHGCVKGHQVIPLPEFIEVYKGKGS
jgi:hypothetical protein